MRCDKTDLVLDRESWMFEPDVIAAGVWHLVNREPGELVVSSWNARLRRLMTLVIVSSLDEFAGLRGATVSGDELSDWLVNESERAELIADSLDVSTNVSTHTVVIELGAIDGSQLPR